MSCFISFVLNGHLLMVCFFNSCRCASCCVTFCIHCTVMKMDMSMVMLMASMFSLIPSFPLTLFSLWFYLNSQSAMSYEPSLYSCVFYIAVLWVKCIEAVVIGLLCLSWIPWLSVCNHWLHSLLLQRSSGGISLAYVVFLMLLFLCTAFHTLHALTDKWYGSMYHIFWCLILHTVHPIS